MLHLLIISFCSVTHGQSFFLDWMTTFRCTLDVCFYDCILFYAVASVAVASNRIDAIRSVDHTMFASNVQVQKFSLETTGRIIWDAYYANAILGLHKIVWINLKRKLHGIFIIDDSKKRKEKREHREKELFIDPGIVLIAVLLWKSVLRIRLRANDQLTPRSP